ncbi:hypothetical protein DPEC_G00205060 [Dallia pectoralis]|uniref:Uncharacterized protein n=1 Tax=Dallia pectoralis TaxID=75939 RepID=A0ACC2G469_DALPE|nr:hypothetical protein DPEC_G00205060 [Dallia pectoralis]
MPHKSGSRLSTSDTPKTKRIFRDPQSAEGKKVHFQTLFPARLRVRHDDGAKTYDTIEEASENLRRRGYTITIIRPPEALMEQELEVCVPCGRDCMLQLFVFCLFVQTSSVR